MATKLPTLATKQKAIVAAEVRWGKSRFRVNRLFRLPDQSRHARRRTLRSRRVVEMSASIQRLAICERKLAAAYGMLIEWIASRQNMRLRVAFACR